MRKIILYIAQSADGYIADKAGRVEWLEKIPNPENTDYGYQDFYQDIDTTIMGNRTSGCSAIRRAITVFSYTSWLFSE